MIHGQKHVFHNTFRGQWIALTITWYWQEKEIKYQFTLFVAYQHKETSQILYFIKCYINMLWIFFKPLAYNILTLLKNKGGWKYIKLEYFHSSLKPTRQTSLCEGSARFSVVYQLMINIFISNLSLWKAVYVMRTLFIPIILGRVLLTDVVKK